MVPRGTIEALRESGVEVDTLAARLGLADPEHVTSAQAEAFLEHALREVDDPAFGLTLGAQVRPELFSSLGLSAITAPTLRAAFERLATFKPALSGDSVQLREGDGLTWVSFEPSRAHRQTARIRADAELAFVATFAARFSRRRPTIVAVQVRGPAPRWASRYRAVFGVRPRFEAPRDAIAFRSAELDTPLVSTGHSMAGWFAERATSHLAGLDERPWTRQTRLVLRESLATPLTGVAARLSVTPRTLQRRLAEEGQTFQQLHEHAREQLARELLRHSSISLAELSDRLGFNNPNAFHRAFRRWTGQTAGDFRATR